MFDMIVEVMSIILTVGGFIGMLLFVMLKKPTKKVIHSTINGSAWYVEVVNKDDQIFDCVDGVCKRRNVD